MSVRILTGDCREILKDIPDLSIDCCVTSPPYFGLRDYGVDGQIGLEDSPDSYVAKMVYVLRQVRRKLRTEATLWLNVGDSYATNARNEGIKAKDLIGIPWLLAFALRADGWYLRSSIIWAKPNGMPGSQEDRCTSSYEFIFLLSKSQHYWSDFDAIKTQPRESSMVRAAQDVQAHAGSHRANGGAKTNGPMKAVGVLTGSPHNRHVLGDAIPYKERRSDKQRGHSRTHAGFNERWDAMSKSEQQPKPATMRDVWFVAPAQFSEAHYAVMPDEIARRCILAGCPESCCASCGTVLDSYLKQYETSTNGQVMAPLQMVRREGDSGSTEQSEELLQQGMRFTVDCEESINNKRIHDHEPGIQGNILPGASGCVQGRICAGASSCDGESFEAQATSQRDCASQKSCQIGQPFMQSTDFVKDNSRQDAEIKMASSQVPSLRRIDRHQRKECPKCGADLETADAITPGVVLDCFGGAGTTGLVADRLQRNAILIELNPVNADMARNRIERDSPLFAAVSAA